MNLPSALTLPGHNPSLPLGWCMSLVLAQHDRNHAIRHSALAKKMLSQCRVLRRPHFKANFKTSLARGLLFHVWKWLQTCSRLLCEHVPGKWSVYVPSQTRNLSYDIENPLRRLQSHMHICNLVSGTECGFLAISSAI